MTLELLAASNANERVLNHPIRCYDNGGKTMDRYTVVYMDSPERDGTFQCVGMNHEPFHPQGFGQHSTAMPGRYLGRRIGFGALPTDCRDLVLRDLGAPVCPKCGKLVWDGPFGHKLAKCWGCGTAFDTMD